MIYDFKQQSWKKFLSTKSYKFHRFVHFSKFYQKLYFSLSQLEDTFLTVCGYDLSFFDKALDFNVKGISGTVNSSKQICFCVLIILHRQHNIQFVLKKDV